ncbi:MAG: hypothetical protein J5659_01445 [Clostridia bacterium]|nr:hypothetical protein [Clostridia bacterium]
MCKHIKIKLSGLSVDIEYKNEIIAGLCRDYTSEFTAPDIRVTYSKEGCENEARISGHAGAQAEFANIYRQIAEKLPRFSRAVAHGAVVSYNGNAYMFIAKSGTGKTTHMNLWQKYFEGVKVINGDKPILYVKNDNVYAFGTPWAGKEMLQENTVAPLKGICLIKRNEKNSIKRLENREAFEAIIKQIYLPENQNSLDLTIKIINDIIRLVPFYELSCNISREAAECSFAAMTSDQQQKFMGSDI